MTWTNSLPLSIDRYQTRTDPSSELPAKHVPVMFHLSLNTSPEFVSSSWFCYYSYFGLYGSMIIGLNVNILLTYGSSNILSGSSESKSLTTILWTITRLSEPLVTIMWNDLPARGAHAISLMEPECP